MGGREKERSGGIKEEDERRGTPARMNPDRLIKHKPRHESERTNVRKSRQHCQARQTQQRRSPPISEHHRRQLSEDQVADIERR